MYRPKGFLLRHDYTVHLRAVDCLAELRYRPLWDREFGSADDDSGFVPEIVSVIEAVREAYRPYGKPTDTLVTKVLLGTLGCLPACDRLFRDGFKSRGRVNERFIKRVLRFCRENFVELKNEQARIEKSGGVYYPLMKLVDMYFWQIGYEKQFTSNEVIL